MAFLDSMMQADPIQNYDPSDPTGRMGPIPNADPNAPLRPTLLPLRPQPKPLTAPADTTPNVTQGAGGFSGTTPAASSPAFPGTPKSTAPSALDQILSGDRTALDAARQKMAGFEGGPAKAHLSKLGMIMALLTGAAEGGITGSPQAGMKVMAPILAGPQNKADADWQKKYGAAQRGYEDQIQKYNVDLGDAREQRAGRAEQANEADRAENRRIQQENQDREKNRDVQAGKYHEEEVQRQTNRDAAEERHWNEEVRLRRAELASRLTGQEKQDASILRTYLTSATQRQNAIDARIVQIDSNIMAKNDPSAQAERSSLVSERAAMGKEVDDIHAMMDEHLKGNKPKGLPGEKPKSQAVNAPPNYTVTAPGKPPVQKFLSPADAQKLQQAGIQIAPINQPQK